MRDTNRELLEAKLERPFLPPKSFGKLRTWMDLDGVAVAAAVVVVAVLFCIALGLPQGGKQTGDPQVKATPVKLGDSTQDLLTGMGEPDAGLVMETETSEPPPLVVENVKGQDLKKLDSPVETQIDVTVTQDRTGDGLKAITDAGTNIREKEALNAAAGMALGGAQVTGVLRVDPNVKTVVYVIDRSGSMATDRRLERVKAELVFAVRALDVSQKFCIIFFDDFSWVLGENGPTEEGSRSTLKLFEATAANKKMAVEWIVSQSNGGSTNAGPACFLGLTARPELLMLLSDGEFPPSLVGEITQRNNERSGPGARIDCVGVAESIQTLQEIAKKNKGVYYSAR